MSTPVLSKKQQKKALSGKKVPVKGLRNVLAQPYGFSWPILKDDNVDELKLLLETSMPAIKRTSPDIPWARLHKMNKTERQAARKEARLKLDVPLPDVNIVNSIVMGVNGVTRLLEKDDAACIILEANVEPMLLIKHIVSMADLKNVSVILVSFLKNVMLETVGFACAALALKKRVAEAEDHHFHKLYQKVVELAKSIERSKPLKLDFKQDIENRLTIDEPVMVPEKSCDKEKVETNKLFTLSTDVYKYRTSRKERVFVPESTTGSETGTERLGSDFISVEKDLGFAVSDVHRHVKNKRKTRYVDIHGEDDKNPSEIKDDSMQLDEYLASDSDRNLSGLPSDQTSAMDGVALYETKSAILGIGDESLLISEEHKPTRDDEKRNKKFKYESLKVKRLQGNFKRVKATKAPKRNKK